MTSQQPITNLGTVAPPQPSATLPLGPPQMMFVAQHRPGQAGWILALIGLVIGVVVIAAQAETVDDLDRCLQGNQAACEDI